jgi:hypothetical protein
MDVNYFSQILGQSLQKFTLTKPRTQLLTNRESIVKNIYIRVTVDHASQFFSFSLPIHRDRTNEKWHRHMQHFVSPIFAHVTMAT